MEFKTDLELAQNLKDPIEERKAARVLGLFTFPWPLFTPHNYLPFFFFFGILSILYTNQKQ